MAARKKSRRRERYDILISSRFTPYEASALSILPRKTPAIKAMIAERIDRRERFDKLAQSKIATGKWKRGELHTKWLANLSRMYSKFGARVKFGPVGKQEGPPRGAPNVWALYRKYVATTPDKRYRSPWEVRRRKSGAPKPKLNRAAVFAQKAKREAKSGQTVSRSTLTQWIAALNTSLIGTSGERRRQLIKQRDSLRKLL